MKSLENFQEITSVFKGEPVMAVYFFGSRAQIKSTPISDYDLAVMFSPSVNKKERFYKRLKYLGLLIKALKTERVELVDLADLPPSFVREIKETGRLIFTQQD